MDMNVDRASLNEDGLDKFYKYYITNTIGGTYISKPKNIIGSNLLFIFLDNLKDTLIMDIMDICAYLLPKEYLMVFYSKNASDFKVNFLKALSYDLNISDTEKKTLLKNFLNHSKEYIESNNDDDVNLKNKLYFIYFILIVLINCTLNDKFKSNFNFFLNSSSVSDFNRLCIDELGYVPKLKSVRDTISLNLIGDDIYTLRFNDNILVSMELLILNITSTTSFILYSNYRNTLLDFYRNSEIIIFKKDIDGTGYNYNNYDFELPNKIDRKLIINNLTDISNTLTFFKGNNIYIQDIIVDDEIILEGVIARNGLVSIFNFKEVNIDGKYFLKGFVRYTYYIDYTDDFLVHTQDIATLNMIMDNIHNDKILKKILFKYLRMIEEPKSLECNLSKSLSNNKNPKTYKNDEYKNDIIILKKENNYKLTKSSIYIKPFLRKVSDDYKLVDIEKLKYANRLGFNINDGYTIVKAHQRTYKKNDVENINYKTLEKNKILKELQGVL